MQTIHLLYRILAGQSSSGKLGGREVKTSALVSRRSWVRILPELPVNCFHRHSESTEYAVLYTRRWRAKLNQLFIITQRKSAINLSVMIMMMIKKITFNTDFLEAAGTIEDILVAVVSRIFLTIVPCCTLLPSWLRYSWTNCSMLIITLASFVSIICKWQHFRF